MNNQTSPESPPQARAKRGRNRIILAVIALAVTVLFFSSWADHESTRGMYVKTVPQSPEQLIGKWHLGATGSVLEYQSDGEWRRTAGERVEGWGVWRLYRHRLMTSWRENGAPRHHLATIVWIDSRRLILRSDDGQQFTLHRVR